MEPSARIQTVHANLQHKHEMLRNELHVVKRKLESKNDALLIISRELAECQGERNQLRIMADQLRSRCQALKKQLLAKDAGISDTFCTSGILSQLEFDELKQKLADAEGDIKILRAKIVKHRLGTTEPTTPERKTMTAHERDELIEGLEKSRLEYSQLEQDMKQLLDLKEELETERDTYKTKYNRLNNELNYIMRGDEKHVVDVDALIMENRFLQQRVKHLEEENATAQSALKKYKHLIEKKKPSSILKSTTNHVIGGLLISQRQVKQLLATPTTTSAQSSPQMVQELKTLAATLLETINDKNLALNHQRKSNKLLGSRITDLEQKLRQLELSGDCHNFREMFGGLGEIRADCANLKMLVPNSSMETSISEKSDSDALDQSTADADILDQSTVDADILDQSTTGANAVAAQVSTETAGSATHSDDELATHCVDELPNEHTISLELKEENNCMLTFVEAAENCNLSDADIFLSEDVTVNSCTADSRSDVCKDGPTNLSTAQILPISEKLPNNVFNDDIIKVAADGIGAVNMESGVCSDGESVNCKKEMTREVIPIQLSADTNGNLPNDTHVLECSLVVE